MPDLPALAVSVDEWQLPCDRFGRYEDGGCTAHGVEACGEGRAQRVLARSQPRSLLCVSDFIITEIGQRLPCMQPLALPQPGGPSL